MSWASQTWEERFSDLDRRASTLIEQRNELLEACKMALLECMTHNEEKSHVTPKEKLDKLRAAIKKAEGEG